MDEAIVRRIQHTIDDIVARDNVTILHAIESGSRAWGFASQDSDYDVRFIYVRPVSEYLHITPIRDVIELPIDAVYDINGWDLPKALSLLTKSNPTVFEWLSSPIIYRQHPAIKLMSDAAPAFFNQVSTSYHYLNMARKNAAYLQTDLVMRKKYLYVLRPLFCIDWITAHGTMPPMRFSELLDFGLNKATQPELADAIEELLAQKAAGKEIEKQPRDSRLDTYIEARLTELATANFGTPLDPDYAQADALLLNILQQTANVNI